MGSTVLAIFLLLLTTLLFRFQLEPNLSLLVDITILKNATHEGAVCLDGSPPAYHFHKGVGSGTKNWLLFIEGGGWCHNHASCAKRSKTALGSSKFMKTKASFAGILSNSPVTNPDFYNWNKVFLRYCDGGLFAGDGKSTYNEAYQPLMYRGLRIWRAIMKDLMLLGLNQADKALLSGRSAGGLATIIHCNDFQSLLPVGAEAKCISDAGFFVDVEDISGKYSIRPIFRKVVDLHNIKPALPEACVSKFNSECLFPRNEIPHVKVPLFILNSAYDSWQIQHILAPPSSDRHSKWKACTHSFSRCSVSQLKTLQVFREKLLSNLEDAFSEYKNDDWGVFIVSCLVHSQLNTKHWTKTSVGNMTIREAVGNWYFRRSLVEVVDKAYEPSISKNCG